MAPSASVPPSSDVRAAELAIVGAGPVGLYAAYYAGFRGLDTIVFDTLPLAGGQIAAFYPDTTVYDVAGFPAVTGRELVERLLVQARSFPTALQLGEEVMTVARAGADLVLDTRRTREPHETLRYRVRAVLVVAGIGSFTPQHLPDAALVRFEGKGLSYFPPPVDEARGSDVVVLGGSERAVEVALGLAETASRVTLVHRRDRLPIGDELRARLDASPVRFLPFHELARVDGAARVERVVLTDRRDARELQLDAALVVPCYGFHADASALGRFGARLEADAILVDSRMASDVPGIYAAGDGATYPGKVRLLAADFGEACTAINNIAAAIVPGANLFPGYSSHRKGAPRRRR
jgi:thioredoxin reductase (NADPH)